MYQHDKVCIMKASVQPHSRHALQQNALLVYLQHSLQQVQQLHGVLTTRSECSPQWKPAVTVAEELLKYYRNSIADQSVRMLTICGAYALAAVSHLEESLRWASHAASSRTHTPEYSHRHSLCRHSAHFYINALIALGERDAELASLWKIAADVLATAANSHYKIQVPSLLTRRDIPGKPERPRVSSDARNIHSSRPSLSLWKLAERHLRVMWAYAVVDEVMHITSSDAETRSVRSYRVLLRGKGRHASDTAAAYQLAAEYEDKASDNAHAGVAAVWHRASELMTTAAALGERRPPRNASQGLLGTEGISMPCSSPYSYAKAVAQLAESLDRFPDNNSQPHDSRNPDVVTAPPLRLRKTAEARARRLDELAGQISCSALLTAPTGDMTVEYRRLQLLIESSAEAQSDFEMLLRIKEQLEAIGAKPGRANAVAAGLLRTAAADLSTLMSENGARDARLRRHKVGELVSLTGGICHGANTYFQNACSAIAVGNADAAAVWTKAGELLLSAVELTYKKLETADILLPHYVLAGHTQEHAAARYADLARALECDKTASEELHLLRTSCEEWDAIIQYTPGSDDRIEAILRIRAQFNAALDDALALYVDSFGGSSEALARLASLVGEAVAPLEDNARHALINERTKLADTALHLATLLAELTASDIGMDAQLTRSLSDCTSLVTTTAQALVAENFELATARVALLSTLLWSIRAKLDRSALQLEIFIASEEARKAAVDVLCASSAPNYARVQLRLQVADALLDEAQRQSPATDALPKLRGAPQEEPVLGENSPKVQIVSLVEEIVGAYGSAATATASAKDPLLSIKDDKQRKHIKKAHEKLGQLSRQLGDALSELADLRAGTSLAVEEHARQLSARGYEVRALSESVRCYQHILKALMRGQNSAAAYWKQAAIIRELPALHSDRVPTTSQLRKIPEAGLIEDVLAAGSAYYEMAALALELGGKAHVQVLLFAAKQAMETLSFLQVGQVVVPEENEARVKANLKILGCVAPLADAVAAGRTGAEECFQAVRQEFAALREPGTEVWSKALAERFEELHHRVLPFTTS